MSLTLKVRIGTPPTDQIKSVKFIEDMGVYEMIKIIQEKLPAGSAATGKDHRLFKPVSETSGPYGGKWMDNNKPLSYYSLMQNDCIELRKRHQICKVKLVDGMVKTIQEDVSLELRGFVEKIGKKLQLRGAEEYSLQLESNPGVWMDEKKDCSVLEQLKQEPMAEVLLLKKKYFITDAAVSRDDPVALHFVYAQSRHDIVGGIHPTSRDEAISLAGILCQIDKGSYSVNIAKLDLSILCAPQWRVKQQSAFEKDVVGAWKQLAGMVEVNAKFRFVQFCRSLKTYGMSTFIVKEKGMKKGQSKLLGFTRDSIIKMSDDTKVVEHTWPFAHLKRWAASGEQFTLDFGSHEDDYQTFLTKEGEAIAKLIAGYIDILLLKQKQTVRAYEDEDGGDISQVEDISRGDLTAKIGRSEAVVKSSNMPEFLAKDVNTLQSGIRAMEKLSAGLTNLGSQVSQSPLTLEQLLAELGQKGANLSGIFNDMGAVISCTATAPEQKKLALDKLSKNAVQAMESLANCQMSAASKQPEHIAKMFNDCVKAVSDSMTGLLKACSNVIDDPLNPDNKLAYEMASDNLSAQLARLDALRSGDVMDMASTLFIQETGRRATSLGRKLVQSIKNDPNLNPKNTAAATAYLMPCADDLAAKLNRLERVTDQEFASLACDPTVSKLMLETAAVAKKSGTALRSGAHAADLGAEKNNQLEILGGDFETGLKDFCDCLSLPRLEGEGPARELISATNNIRGGCTALLRSLGKPGAVIRQDACKVDSGVTSLGMAVEKFEGPRKDDLLNLTGEIASSNARLGLAAQPCEANPHDTTLNAALRKEATEMLALNDKLLSSAGSQVAASSMFASCKKVAASGTSLITQLDSIKATPTSDNQKMQMALATLSPTLAQLGQFKLQLGTIPTSDTVKALQSLLGAAEVVAPALYKLVASCKSLEPHIFDQSSKRDMSRTTDFCTKSLQELLEQCNAVKGLEGMGYFEEARSLFDAANAQLAASLLSISHGNAGKTTKPENAAKLDPTMEKINAAVKEMVIGTKGIASAAREKTSEIGPATVRLAESTGNLTTTGISLSDLCDNHPDEQNDLLRALDSVSKAVQRMAHDGRTLSTAPQGDVDASKMVGASGKEVAAALGKTLEVSKQICNSVKRSLDDDTRKEAVAGTDMEALAIQELQGVAQAIRAAVARITASHEEAKQRRKRQSLSIGGAMTSVDIDQANITDAILDACQAIGQSTSVLIGAATDIQVKFVELKKEKTSQGVPYHSDPAWARGLISASHEVAAAVQHLVRVGDSVSRGECEDETALVVAANEVSATTARLVAASNVKTDVDAKFRNALSECSKQVTAATKALVDAASNASKWRDQRERQAQLAVEEIERQKAVGGARGKFELSADKIREMEEQMEILKLERELSAKRAALLQKRRMQYSEPQPPSQQGPLPTPPTSSPPSQVVPTPPQHIQSPAHPAPQGMWQTPPTGFQRPQPRPPQQPPPRAQPPQHPPQRPPPQLPQRPPQQPQPRPPQPQPRPPQQPQPRPPQQPPPRPFAPTAPRRLPHTPPQHPPQQYAPPPNRPVEAPPRFPQRTPPDVSRRPPPARRVQWPPQQP